MSGKIEVVRDHIVEKLDELADLFECWKRRRDKGQTPEAVRTAILLTVDELESIRQLEPFKK